MKECHYSLDQLMEIRDYNDRCILFMSLAPTEDIKEKIYHILYDGGYQNYALASDICNKDGPLIEATRRLTMAYVLLRNPQTFDLLVQNNINLFHGTNGNALPSILKYGLTSLKEARNNNITISTGEQWSRRTENRNFISFTDMISVADYYSQFSPVEGTEQLNFEVVIGTTLEDVDKIRCTIFSDTIEVGVRKNLPLDKIRMIMVPSDKIDFVKKIVGDQIVVAPLDYKDAFFYVDDEYSLFIDEKRLEEFKKGQRKESKTFSREEVSSLSHTGVLANVKVMIEKMKSLFSGGEVISYDARIR